MEEKALLAELTDYLTGQIRQNPQSIDFTLIPQEVFACDASPYNRLAAKTMPPYPLRKCSSATAILRNIDSFVREALDPHALASDNAKLVAAIKEFLMSAQAKEGNPIDVEFPEGDWPRAKNLETAIILSRFDNSVERALKQAAENCNRVLVPYAVDARDRDRKVGVWLFLRKNMLLRTEAGKIHKQRHQHRRLCDFLF